jgi:sugar O-acyltransferase (sialic acid O-acetyltransferase NeuD family)
MNNIIIVGSSGAAKWVIDVVECEEKYKIIGLLDRYRNVGEKTFGYAILGQEEDLPLLIDNYSLEGAIVAIGDNFIRSIVSARVNNLCPGFPFVSAIHPNAVIAKDVSIGEGTVIHPGNIIGPSCSIGKLCSLLPNSSLGHDTIMSDFSSVGGRVVTGGYCRIGAYAAINIGTVLVNRVTIGEHTVVGAGSTVLTNIEPYSVAYGMPAKTIRTRRAGDTYL